MKPKTYQAPTMAAALAEVKKDLGRSAVIVKTRSFRRGGLLGIGGRRVWEIDAVANPGVDEGQYVSDATTGDEPGPIVSHQATPTAFVGVDDAQPHSEHLWRQVTELHRMVKSLLARHPRGKAQDMPDGLGELFAHLVEQEVEEPLAAEVIQRLRMRLTGREVSDLSLARGKLTELLTEEIATSAPEAQTGNGHARIMALIGPTGVGKTTTIAKLAANFKLQERKRVGLISIDTYRIAAVDQLRTYAEIIEVPLRVVLTAGELRQAVTESGDFDVILIDTAGRSQNDEMRLGQLRNFLGASGAHEVHVVVSASSSRSCIRRTLEQFCPLGANRLVLSKLDEAESFGVILNAALVGKIPISYVTTGQGVPDDIAPGKAETLAQMVVTGRRERLDDN